MTTANGTPSAARTTTCYSGSAGHFLADREARCPSSGVVFQENVDGVPGGLIAPDEAILDEVTRELETLPGRPPEFHYQRSNIYLRFCHRDYDKGTALAELSRLLEMPTDGILAVRGPPERPGDALRRRGFHGGLSGQRCTRA